MWRRVRQSQQRQTHDRAAFFLLVLLVLSWRTPVAAALRPLDCDPCIDRGEYSLKAILPGNSAMWQQVEAAMGQAAVDMGVQLQVQLLAETTTGSLEVMAQAIRDSAESGMHDALIVTIPDAVVQDAVEQVIQEGMPVFGLNLGYEVARLIGVLGFAAQDEYVAGKEVARELIQIVGSNNLRTALFVNNHVGDGGMQARQEGFRDQVLASTNGNSTIEVLNVDPSDAFEHVTMIDGALSNCAYDAVVLGGADSLNVAVSSMTNNDCYTSTVMGSFDETPEVLEAVVKGEIAFGVSQQLYIQSVLPVYFAALYVTTHKALALPLEERVYLSGPLILRQGRLPSDTQQQCAVDSFPVCPNNLGPGEAVAACKCTDRSAIRIGGVLHGVTTDSFWDTVFAAAEQAALDMNVELDLIRYPPDDPAQIHRQMAARIKTLCESGLDGIFVSIPSDEVVESIKRCQELKVPVISVNAGGDLSVELGLLNHIGMLEYVAGFGAGERLVDAGMQRGFCFDHAPGNVVTKARCDGFRDAISVRGGNVIFEGAFDVPLDNQAEYELTVENAVATDGDWKGVGILVLGQNSLQSYIEGFSQSRTGAIVGSFDVSPALYDALDAGYVRFGIDQQEYLQGIMPVYLLTLTAYTDQFLLNHVVESGPSFVDKAPSSEGVVCNSNFYSVCPDKPEENYNMISSGLLKFGYAMFCLLLVGCFASFGWALYFRNTWVVKISQPIFLHWFLVGVILSTLTIPFLGVETGYRYIQDIATGQLTGTANPEIGRVDAACMAVPWLYGVGFAATFSALFAKIQRVKLIYQAGLSMQRKKVKIRDVIHIMVLIPGAEMIILLTWQLVSPHRWERVVTEEEDGFPVESFGQCSSDKGDYFWIALVLYHAICLFYALVLSYQTRDINAEYAESGSLFLTVMFLFQVQVLTVPIVALVQDDTNIFYFVRAIAVFLQNLTVLSLLFGPKIWKTIRGQGNLTRDNTGRNNYQSRASLTRANVGNAAFYAAASQASQFVSQPFPATDSSGGDALPSSAAEISQDFMVPRTPTTTEVNRDSTKDSMKESIKESINEQEAAPKSSP